MSDASRARELLPNVLLTLLSVVQALALEALWSSVRDNPLMFGGGMTAWVVWLQALAVFQGIVVIWLFYIGVVMRFSWVPATRDSIAPFVLGAGELSMIQTLDPALLHYWFWILAAVFTFSARVSSHMLRAGMNDPANAGIEAPESSRLESWASYIASGLIAGLGFIVWLLGGDSAAAIASLVVANLLLFGQGMMIQTYWRRWVGGVSGR